MTRVKNILLAGTMVPVLALAPLVGAFAQAQEGRRPPGAAGPGEAGPGREPAGREAPRAPVAPRAVEHAPTQERPAGRPPAAAQQDRPAATPHPTERAQERAPTRPPAAAQQERPPVAAPHPTERAQERAPTRPPAAAQQDRPPVAAPHPTERAQERAPTRPPAAAQQDRPPVTAPRPTERAQERAPTPPTAAEQTPGQRPTQGGQRPPQPAAERAPGTQPTGTQPTRTPPGVNPTEAQRPGGQNGRVPNGGPQGFGNQGFGNNGNNNGGDRRGGISPGGAAALGAAAGFAGGFLAGSAAQSLDGVRRDRRESVEDGRTYIREPGRTIVEDGDRSYIVHDENDRFRELGYRVDRQRRGNDFVDVIDRPDGTQVLTFTTPDGRMLRRVRRDRDGREYVLIDNGYEGRVRPPSEDIVVLPAPPITIPRERYDVDYQDADEGVIYDTFAAPPLRAPPQRYTLDQIRYSPDVRRYVRSVDINTINFDPGSWIVPASATGKLRALADGIKRTIDKDHNSVFLVEGYTDATGNPTDNLSLSDRRAQSVAAILSKDFGIPPENLTTQGYGQQNLKVNTQGSSAANRRVVVQNITPLLAAGGNASR